jgi:hypothetical protein
VSKSTINPRNQGGLRYLFDTIDPKSNPESIDMETITPVVEMSFGGYSKLNDYTNLDHCQQVADNIAGQSLLHRTMLSYGNFDGGGDPQIAYPVGYNAMVWGLKTHVKFDAAGAAAFNGKFITCVIKMYERNGIDMDKVFWTVKVETLNRIYQPWITRESLCIVPSECKLELWWLVQDGVNFPANTTLDYKLITQSFPIGCPFPIGV